MESWVVEWIRTNGLGIWVEFLFREMHTEWDSLTCGLCKRPEAEASSRICASSLREVSCAFQTTLPTPSAEADLARREATSLHVCYHVCASSLLLSGFSFPSGAPFEIIRFSYLFLFHFPPDMYVKCPFFFSILNLLNFFSCQGNGKPSFRCLTLF